MCIFPSLGKGTDRSSDFWRCPKIFSTTAVRWRNRSAINKTWKKEINLVLTEFNAHPLAALLKEQGLRPLKPVVWWASYGFPMGYHFPENLEGFLAPWMHCGSIKAVRNLPRKSKATPGISCLHSCTSQVNQYTWLDFVGPLTVKGILISTLCIGMNEAHLNKANWNEKRLSKYYFNWSITKVQKSTHVISLHLYQLSQREHTHCNHHPGQYILKITSIFLTTKDMRLI